MKRAIRLALAVAINAIIATVSQAQTNSCISTTDGFWDEARLWSLATPPSIAQSAILITNAASETVTIDSITANSFLSTLTISNLSVAAPLGNTNTLYLDNTGTIALHILDGLTIEISLNGFGDEDQGGGELISTNSTLIVDGLLGGQLVDDGTMVITDGSLITTNCSLLVAASSYTVGLLIISNGVVQARDVSIATPGNPASGTIEVIGGTMTLSASLNVGNGGEGSQSSLFVANGGLLVVTNGFTAIGDGDQSSGTMTVSNATFLAANVFLGGEKSGGSLAIDNGTVTLSGQLGLGAGEQGSGSVSLNGGMLVVTNGAISLGVIEPSGLNTMIVSNGLFLARDVYVGYSYSDDALYICGGTSILSSNLQIGATFSGATVSITGGQLFVTNAPIVVEGEAQCGVSGGQLAAKTIQLYEAATLTVNGGSVTVSEGITLGDCNDDVTDGYASVDGGQLIVTNAAHTGFIDVRDGQLVLSNGVLQVDRLVMTNTCSQFIHTGGTLLVGSVILDPNAFQITSVAREGNNLRITWLMAPGLTNALQATAGGTLGSYTTNGFADIFIVTNNTATGTLTNYLDIGGATNIPSRFYRARLSP
jgi:hypothetical protein